MACGAPVITSSTSSMPEVAGSAAIITDPLSPGEMADAMILVQDNPGIRRKMITDGYLRASTFSWTRMAEKMLDIYRQVVEEKSSPEKAPLHC
jgi:glycosyltransferase involved in cell wall biosynthesis